MSFTKNSTSAGAYENFNTIWAFTDNLSKVIGKHTIKVGATSRTIKDPAREPRLLRQLQLRPRFHQRREQHQQRVCQRLARDTSTYSQQTARAVFNDLYWNAEFYIQDNWRVNSQTDSRLRRPLLPPDTAGGHQQHLLQLRPSLYSKASKAPRIYIPGTSGGKRVAIDPAQQHGGARDLHRSVSFPTAAIRPTACRFWERTAPRWSPTPDRPGRRRAPRRLRLRCDRRRQDRPARRLRHLLQPPRRQPGVCSVRPGALLRTRRRSTTPPSRRSRPAATTWCSDLPTINSWPLGQQVRGTAFKTPASTFSAPSAPAPSSDVGYTGNWGYNQQPAPPTSTPFRSAPGLRSIPRMPTRPTATATARRLPAHRLSPGYNRSTTTCLSATRTTTP